MHRVQPAHVFESRRDAKLRKGLAALGHRGAQGAARFHESAHACGGHMHPRGAEPRMAVGSLGEDARIEPFPVGGESPPE